MPTLNRKQNGGWYVRTVIERKPITYQLTSEGAAHLAAIGLTDGSFFDKELLFLLLDRGWAYTAGGGPGDELSDPLGIRPSTAVPRSQPRSPAHRAGGRQRAEEPEMVVILSSRQIVRAVLAVSVVLWFVLFFLLPMCSGRPDTAAP